MNLYLKQKVFSWADKFYVYDENGSTRYYVQGEVFTLGKKLHLYDLQGRELCYLHQKVLSFLPKYYICKNGVDVAQVTKEFTFFHSSYSVDQFGWQVKGDFFDHNYAIYAPEGQIAAVTKEWFTWGDTYCLSFSDKLDPVDVLSVVLIIDACIEAQQNS